MTESLTPTILNVTLALADTEYSQALPAGCKYFTFQTRSAVDIRFAFATGKVATPTAPYATLKSGGAFTSPEKFGNTNLGITLYFGTDDAGAVVEIVAYY